MLNTLPCKDLQEKRIAELEDDFFLLIDQLHIVQEELENRHIRDDTQKCFFPNDELVEAVSDNIRQQRLLATLQEVHALESSNSLRNILGNLLLQSVESPKLLFTLPNKLLKIWREWTRETPPMKLGGNGYKKIIELYQEGGLLAVDALFASNEFSPKVQANAFTALARNLLQTKIASALEAAHRAYAIDPRPFRLKWLAFRIDEAGDAIKAEAMLDSLPQDMHFSTSELRQANQIRTRAKQARLQEAKQKTQFSKRSEEFAAQLRALSSEKDEQIQLASSRLEQIEILQQKTSQLEQEHIHLATQLRALSAERDEHVQLASSQLEQIEILQQKTSQFEQDYTQLLEEKEKIEEERAALNEALSALEQEATRTQLQAEKEKLELTRAQLQVEKEKLELTNQVKKLEQEIESRDQSHDNLLTTMAGRVDEIANLTDRQQEDLRRMQRNLAHHTKQQIVNATKQIEASACLHNYFASGELPLINIESLSWPVSPDFALYLVELIEFNDYNVIIEFGSGLSTIVIAKTLATMAERRHGSPLPAFISFDHLETYFQQTLGRLNQAGLADKVQLHLTPLQEYTAVDGMVYSYYACQEILHDVAAQHAADEVRMLVVVDGPPASTGVRARYPACPIIFHLFPNALVDLLLDDYIRTDEKEIVQLWQSELEAASRPFSVLERKLEKEACLISIKK